MARTLRLSDEAEHAVTSLAAAENISQNELISRAVLDYAAKRTSVRDALLAEIVAEDAEILDRLA
ncbi:CopG family transcriptional regulator [Cellulomonas sp. RIT-PI-Y]|uniref:CopG family transcriptional regulator n=1 Tax=Cellulomonas sp. RIT-PI-Y TaxID=3035297 RepID=UPI0021DAE75B|nr:CopG family transcriptional regulator [Cellulomonas sp. RIT-PI-Y]